MGPCNTVHTVTMSQSFPLVPGAHPQVLEHEPGAVIGLTVDRPGSTEVDIELPLDTEQATSGDAFAVLHAM